MTTSLSARVLASIRQRDLLHQGDALVVAVSGGSDSMGLMHVLAKLAPQMDWSLRVVSVDHGLRAESADEVLQVGSAAAALGLAFTAVKLNLPDGANLQARAREARYEVLHVEARRQHAKIALGHTLDDQAETVMGRILRGAGLRGISGVQPKRSDGVVRPLIDVRRGALRSYLRSLDVSWVEDPSNEQACFERVRIRRALATFEDEDPQLTSHLAELADDARDADIALEEMALALGPQLPGLVAAPRAVRRVALRRLAEAELGRGVRRRHLEALEECVLTGKGEVLLGGGWRALPVHGVLRFEEGKWEGRSG